MTKPAIECFDLGLDCDLICEQVLSHRDYWSKRNNFYTFGAASYLDNKMGYFLTKRKINPILKKLFKNLYNKIGDHFGAELNDELAYPGFHIFDIEAQNNETKIHIDDQYEELPLDSKHLTDPKSFTIAFKKPKSGCGLNYWSKINLSGSKGDNMLENRSI